MDEIDIQALEQYLFTDKKEDFIKKLINGTNSFYYFTLLNAINQYGFLLPRQYEEFLQKYNIKSSFNQKNVRAVQLKLKFQKLDSVKDNEKERKLLIKDILKILFPEYDEQFKIQQKTTFQQQQPVFQQQNQVNYYNNANDTEEFQQQEEFNDIEEQNFQQQEIIQDMIQQIQEQQSNSDYSLLQEEKRDEKLISSILDNNKIEFQQVFDKQDYFNSLEQFQKITQLSYTKINMQEFIDKASLKCLKHFFDSTNCLAELMLIPQAFQKLIDLTLQEESTHVEQKINQILDSYQQIFQKLSLDQMEEVKKQTPATIKNQYFVGELLKKKFQLCKIKDLEPEQQRSKIFDVYSFVIKELPHKFQSLRDQLLYEILLLDMKNEKYDFDLFTQYLKNPKQISSFANKKSKEKIQQQRQQQESYNDYWHQVHQLNVKEWVNDDQMINHFITQYIKQNGKYTPFDEYLEIKFLDDLLFKIQLYKGQEIQNITEKFSQSLIKQMTEERLMIICNNNKKYFLDGEEIELKLEIKNIPFLTTKIFEISLENYYLNNLKSFDSNIKLDGLIPSYEQVFENSQPPIVKYIKSFNFSQIIKNQKGFYVIEFIGNGLLSRAIIKKGRLILYESMTLAGHQFNILDENNQICIPSKLQNTEDKTGIWLDKKFYSADQNGNILVPFVEEQKNFKSILVHNQFAEITDIQLKNEQYAFICDFIYHQENLLQMNKAKIIIEPKLYLHNSIADLAIVKDQKIEVITTTDTGIPSTQIFNKINFSYSIDNVIEFQVPAKTIEIKVEVSGNIKPMLNKDIKIQLQQSKLISLNNFQDTNLFCSQYLKKNHNDYYLLLLGKNGEPKKDILIDIQFYNFYFRDPIKITLKTDGQGKILLGKLNEINQLKSQVQDKFLDIKAQDQTWYINNDNKQALYSNQIKEIEGKDIRIPYNLNEINTQNIQFLKWLKIDDNNNFTILSNEITKLKIDKDNSQLVLQNLDQGNYNLTLKQLKVQIQIQIIKGKYFKQQQNVIQTPESIIIPQAQIQEALVIKKVMLQEENNKLGVVIQTPYPQTTKVHLICYQFEQQNNLLFQNQIKNNLKISEGKEISTKKHKNIFASNKQLDDEYCYVLERKKQNRYIGNTLEKPQVLLIRKEVRSTQMDTEKLRTKNPFEYQANEEFDDDEPRNEILCNQNSYNGMNCDIKGRYNLESKNSKMKRKKQCPKKPFPEEKQQSYIEQEVNGLLNFLMFQSQILPNKKLVPISNNEFLVEISIPNLQKFSQLLIIASNEKSIVQKQISITTEESQFGQIAIKDLTQKSNLQKNHFYSIFRNQFSILENQTFQINDLTSTEYQIIDSIEKLFNFLMELSRYELGYKDERLQEWMFLKSWEGLTLDEKHQKYNKFASHELNLFLKFKDPAYFESFILQFLQNKFEKTFVDYFLLQDSQQIIKYNTPSKISQMNAMEQVLLIMYLKQIGQNKDIQFILQFLQNKDKMNCITQNRFKKLFDIILNSKTNFEQEIKEKDDEDQESGSLEGGGGGGQLGKLGGKFYSNFAGQNKMDFCQMAQEQILCFDKSIEKFRSTFQDAYQSLEQPKEYCEKQYYLELPNEKLHQTLSKVPLSSFWVQLGKYIIDSPQTSILERIINNDNFLSQDFMYCTHSLTEIIGIITFIGLPFTPQNHQYDAFQNKGLAITAKSNIMLFQKEIKEAKCNIRNDIIITQRFFDTRNRYKYDEEDPNLKIENDVEEFIVDRIYGCQAIVTNCSSAEQELQILVEVPEGSIPVNTIDYTKSHTIKISPYSTQTLENFFYFPQPGNFGLYSANVSRNGIVISIAKETSFTVQWKQKESKMETIEQILQKGSSQEILDFIETKNLFNNKIFKFSEVYKFLTKEEFYLKYIEILRKRKIFDFQSLIYGCTHGDFQAFIELMNSNQATEKLKKLSISSIETSFYEFYDIKILEYYPLVNSRFHSISQNQNATNINNVQFREQYKKFLTFLIEKNEVKTNERLIIVYYTLLQDRIDMAINQFNQISSNDLNGQQYSLQYDYFDAYFDFYLGYPNFTKARNICEKYLDYPIIYWRNLFYDITNQISEFDGELSFDVAADQQKLANLPKQKQNLINASKEQILQANLDHATIILKTKNIFKVEISYFLIDLEVIFSRNCFLFTSSSQNEKDDFSFVKPNLMENKIIDMSDAFLDDFDINKLSIPEEFQKQNVFIQIKSSQKKICLTYFSSSINVQVQEQYGSLKVTNNETLIPLSKVYVKTFIKKKDDGQTAFYKDGYTDLRGRFDYTSVNTNTNLGNIEKFAFFIMSDQLGSTIKEAQPPSIVGKIDQIVNLKGKKWINKASFKNEIQLNKYYNNQMVFEKKGKKF